ncbi:MAG: hypothetical protein CL467_05010 [Acidimicrobiaceae bacterium]|nr:hypothetical protein [Acidimicrobiaceae bacterium]
MIHRREFLRAGMRMGLLTVAASGVGFTRTRPLSAVAIEDHAGPYGSLDRVSPDANGLVLPAGFTSRVVAEGGLPVAGTDLVWPLFPDGKGTVPTEDGGWLLACNHEVFDFHSLSGPRGGASTISFDVDGRITGAWSILKGSHSNSRGAVTPWGTWLSCQEALGPAGGDGAGLVWECDPFGERPALLRPALGVRTHGSVTVDPTDGRCYLTEAHRDGRLYRFTPSHAALESDSLEAGLLEAMVVEPDGGVGWLTVADPTGTVAPTRVQAAAATVTPMGGGVAVHGRTLWFTTGVDDRVHVVDLVEGQHRVVWDGMRRRQPLAGIGDLAVAPFGEVFVAEDRGDMEVVLLGPDGSARPFCRLTGDDHRLSAVTGPCFDPSGTRMYLSSLRGRGEALVRDMNPDLDWGDGVEGRHVGVTYEITGPFTTVADQSAVGMVDGAAGATTTIGAPATTIERLPATTVSSAGIPTTTVSANTSLPATTSTEPAAAIGAAGEPEENGSATVTLGLGAVLGALGVLLSIRRRRIRMEDGDQSGLEPGDEPST